MKYNFPTKIQPQHQDEMPGIEKIMNPQPIYDIEGYCKSSDRLKGKVAVITGGDSGIGKAVAIRYAKEGAKVCIIYLSEDEDAKNTKNIISSFAGECELFSGDIGKEEYCKEVIQQIINKYGTINIFVSNAAEQHVCNKIGDITTTQLHKTFDTNFFGAFYLTKEILNYMKDGDSIIYTTSITAYHGHETLIDYSCTKGALTSLTRSLAKNLAATGIRVNAVAPGPIWTPLIPSSFDAQKVGEFGSQTSMKRPGQPVELAEAYVFLACDGASYITGETIHINGGEIINS